MRETDFRFGDRNRPGKIYSRNVPSEAALLFIHGLGSSQAGYASRAEATSQTLGVQCLTFNLSGHGDDSANFNRYSVYQHLEDAIAAYDYLAAMSAINPARIGACGASYGAYLVALLSGRRPLKRILLRAPALAKDIEFPSPSQSCDPGREPEDFDSLAILSRYTGETLIVESENDERIPHSPDSCLHQCLPKGGAQSDPGSRA
jgi:uncharacterized protein